MDLSQPQPFRKQIAEAQFHLHKLLAVRRIIDTKINDLRSLIRANANFLPENERKAELFSLEVMRVPTTIAEAVKVTLWIAKGRNERLTPMEIKDRSEERGFDFSSYTNPMASIHTILKRMKEADNPEADFDEATGTYMITGLPLDITDPAFFERVNKQAWWRLASRDAEATKQITGEELSKALEAVTKHD